MRHQFNFELSPAPDLRPLPHAASPSRARPLRARRRHAARRYTMRRARRWRRAAGAVLGRGREREFRALQPSHRAAAMPASAPPCAEWRVASRAARGLDARGSTITDSSSDGSADPWAVDTASSESDGEEQSALAARGTLRSLPRCGVVRFRREGDTVQWAPRVTSNTSGLAARVLCFEEAFMLEEFSSRALGSLRASAARRGSVALRARAAAPPRVAVGGGRDRSTPPISPARASRAPWAVHAPAPGESESESEGEGARAFGRSASERSVVAGGDAKRLSVWALLAQLSWLVPTGRTRAGRRKKARGKAAKAAAKAASATKAAGAATAARAARVAEEAVRPGRRAAARDRAAHDDGGASQAAKLRRIARESVARRTRSDWAAQALERRPRGKTPSRSGEWDIDADDSVGRKTRSFWRPERKEMQVRRPNDDQYLTFIE